MDELARAIEEEARLRQLVAMMRVLAVDMEVGGFPEEAKKLRATADQLQAELDAPPDFWPLAVVLAFLSGVVLFVWAVGG